MSILEFIAGGYVLTIVTWLFYLAAMNLSKHKDNMYPVAKAHAYVIVFVGVALDVILNVVVMSVVFLEPPHPKRLLFTARLTNLVKNGHGWRQRLAKWFCVHLLDQFDPSGKHCD